MRIFLRAAPAVFCLVMILLVGIPRARSAFAEEAEDSGRKAADTIVGTWHILTAVRGQEMTSRIMITRAEDGTLSGTYLDSRGTTSALRELRFSDGALTFKRAAGPRVIGFSGTIDGATIKGFHQIGPRKIPTEGRRGKAAFDKFVAARRKANERGEDLEADYEKHKRRAAPRDAFPVLFDPKLTPAADAKDIRADEPVIGVFLGGEAQAYPISIMGVHELVNITCGGQPIAVSW